MSPTPKPLIIRKSNALIEASHKLSISEQRLLILLASTITPDDEDFKEYELTISKYAEMFKIDLNEFNKSLYGTLETAVDSLMKQQISFKNGEEIIKRQWVSVSRYIPNSGVVRLKFDADLKPYFLQLKDRFTQYYVENIVSFRGQYSPRLYELLKAEAYKAKRGLFERFFQIDDLRFILGVNLNSYTVFNDFKLYVINPSVNEISLSSDLVINEVRYGKTGRKITNVTFLVEVLSKDQANLKQTNLLIEETKQEKENDNHPVIDSLLSLGFSIEIAKKYKNKHGVKKIERNIAYTLAKKQEGKVKDIPSYLNTAIENDYGGAWEIENQKKAEAKKQQDKLDQVKMTSDEKAKQERNAQNQKAFNDFLLLPENQQKELKREFFEKADSTIKGKIIEAERKGIDIFTSPLVLSPFKVFLVDQKGF